MRRVHLYVICIDILAFLRHHKNVMELKPMTALRDRQIQIRAPHSAQMLIDRAAAKLGVTRSQFMLQTSIQAAEDVLLDRTVFVLSPETWTAFEEALDAPVDADALRDLLSAPSPWER